MLPLWAPEGHWIQQLPGGPPDAGVRTTASCATVHPLLLLVCTAHPCCKATVGKQLRLYVPSQLSLQGSGRT